MNKEGFILISKEGKYVIPQKSGGWATEYNEVGFVSDLNHAYVFSLIETKSKYNVVYGSYRKTIDQYGCKELSAQSRTIVEIV